MSARSSKIRKRVCAFCASVFEYAAWSDLNRNEALGRFGRRVTRVYKYQGKEFYHNDYQK